MNSVPSETTASISRLPRLAGLDALRALAMMLGVVLHTSQAYMVHTPEGVFWPIKSVEKDLLADIFYYWVHTFRLPVFFLLSGFFSEMIVQSRGTSAYFEQRRDRLLIPYIISLLTIGNLVLAVSVWGWLVSGYATRDQLQFPFQNVPPQIRANGFGPVHLWFLQDLFVISLAYWWLRLHFQFVPRTVNTGLLQNSWGWLTGPLLVAIPVHVILTGDASLLMGFHNTFFVVPTRLLYYGYFFSLGVIGFCQRDLVFAWTRPALRQLLLMLVLSIPMVWFMLTAAADENPNYSLVLATLSAPTIGLALFGWFGLFLHYWTWNSPWVRYLSDSAYWVYLSHFPVVIMLQILLHQSQLSVAIQMLIISVTTLIVCLLSYQLLVRYTVIGRMLHGTRERFQHNSYSPAIQIR